MQRQSKLDKVLEELELKITDSHYNYVEKLHLKSMAHEKIDHLPLSLIVEPTSHIELFPYEEIFNDPEKMLYNELFKSFGCIYNSVMLQDEYPLHIRSNHGICAIPSMFGAKVSIIGGNMPWVKHCEDLSEIKKLISHGVPDIKNGVAAQIFDTYAYYNDRLNEYPNCAKHIRLSQPDMQGPFDNAHLLMGSEIFYMLYDEPEIVHELLDVLTDTYIKYHSAVKPLLNDEAGNNAVYLHGGIYGGKAIVKDDTAIINLSKEHYIEFAQQYNERIENALGEISIHYCGKALDWHFDVIKNKKVTTMNFGNPDLNDLSMLYGQWSSYKTPIVFWGYNGGIEALSKTIKSINPKTGMTLAVIAKDMEEGKRIKELNYMNKLFI